MTTVGMRARAGFAIFVLISILISAPSPAQPTAGGRTDTPETELATRPYQQFILEGRYDLAVQAARMQVQALADRTETAPADRAAALADLGAACNAAAMTDSARTVLAEALAIHEELGTDRQRDAVWIMIELARAENGANQPDQAESWSRRAMAVARDTDGESSHAYAAAQSHLADAIQNRGAYAEAIPIAEAARDRLATAAGVPSPDAAYAELVLASCYNGRGRYDEGLTACRAAVVQCRELYGEAHPRLADALGALAFTIWRRADYAEAERIQRDVLAMRLEFFVPVSEPVMECHAMLGLILNSDLRYEDSLVPHQQAIAIGREILGGDHLNLAYMLNNYGLALQNLQRLEPSETALLEAYEMMERLGRGDDPGVTYMLQNLAGIAMYRDRDDRAAELWREVEIRHRRQRGESFEGVATARAALGTIAYRQDNVPLARDWYLAAGRSHDQARLRAGRGVTRAAFWASPYEKLAALEVELGRAEAAWETLEKARSRSLADVLWNAEARALDPVEAAEEKALRADLIAAEDRVAELARMVETAPDSSAALTRAENGLMLTRNRWDAFERRMADLHPTSEGHALPLDRVQATLPADGALVGWLDVRLMRQAPTRWAYVVRSAGEIIWIQLRDGRQEITDRSLWIKPRDLRLAIVPERPSPLGPGPETDRQRLAARLLHEQWFEPLLPHLEGVTHLIAVPSISLAGAPLEAFADADGVLLGDRFAVSYAPSATVHAWLVEQGGHDRTHPRDGLLVADPPFRPSHATAPVDTVAPILLSSLDASVLRDALAADPAALASLPRLTWSRHEVSGVASAFPRSDLVVGLDASELTLRDLASEDRLTDYRFLHFATHALVDAESPQRSTLVLSQVGERAGAAEGLLTAAEIAREWSLDAELVTLSACETALGREIAGEGVVGFSYPLLQAGARCLLLSLWPVDDHATALLMGRFYATWAAGELSKDESLQAAKRWLREYRDASADRPYAHPFYWSSFVLIGDAG